MKEKLEQYINDALNKLYENDYYLIDHSQNSDTQNQTYNHVGERAIVFRFAHYLSNSIENDDELKIYNLDCEYNRNLNGLKITPSHCKGCIPDIIIHQRGTNENNLLVIEVKPHWNTKTSKDIGKIKKLCAKNGEYRYKYGVSIVIGTDRNQVKIKWI